MADSSADSFSSTSGLLTGAAPDEPPAQAPALSPLNPSRTRGFRALVRQAARAESAVPPSTSQTESPRTGRALSRSNASMSQASGSPLLSRLGEVSALSFTQADNIEAERGSPTQPAYGE